MYIFFNLKSSISYDHCSYSHRRHSHQENATIAKDSKKQKKNKTNSLLFSLIFHRLQSITDDFFNMPFYTWQHLAVASPLTAKNSASGFLFVCFTVFLYKDLPDVIFSTEINSVLSSPKNIFVDMQIKRIIRNKRLEENGTE